MQQGAQIRYGVIGTGMMGVEHIENILALDGATVTAISDINADSRAAGQHAAGSGVAVFEDHHDVLESGLCDAVVVATPNHTHIDVMPELLATELHVMVEKPLCITVADCERLVALEADRPAGAITWMAMEYRYMPAVAELIRLVREGVVGIPRMVAIHEHRFPFLVKVGDWNRFNEYTGGTLVEKTCHYFDLMNLILGERPWQVMASGAQDVNHLDERYDGRTPDIFDNAFVIVEYPSGARAMLDLCMFAEATDEQEQLSVVGELGKVEARMPSNTLLVGRRGEHWVGGVERSTIDDERIGHEGLHHGSSFIEHLQFAEAIRTGGRPEVTLDDGSRAVAIGIAAHRSIDLGRPVELAEIVDRGNVVTVELSWFSALCDDDYEFLGVPDPELASSWEHCRDIVLTADRHGFDNVLLPSGYALGIDNTTFAAGMAPITTLRMLLAVRCGELVVPQLARQLASLDEMLGGRLAINIISSDVPGAQLGSEPRYRRSTEIMYVLRRLLDGRPVDFHGEFVDLEIDPPRVGTASGRSPLFYFGGLSPAARDCAAAGADVYLMWPDTTDQVLAVKADLDARAAAKGRSLRYGWRSHVIVRETEDEARSAAERLVSRLDGDSGEAIRARSLDAGSSGVARQAALREGADDDGYVERHLWTGIGRARSGAGAAIVGDPDQVLAKLTELSAAGIEAFILSGYPHLAECDLFARHVLPHIDHGRLEFDPHQVAVD